MEAYLDNSATTKVFPEVAALVTKLMCEDYGNPSSMHKKGVEAENYIKQAKQILAKLMKVNEKEIFFTSGGTESDNLALIGCAMANQRSGKHIITTKIEHPAVLQTCAYLETLGFEVTYLPVDKTGRICLADLQKAMRKDTILVSIMYVNNEIGSVQPIDEAGALIKKLNPNTLFHVDAVQGFGKYKIYPKRAGIDLMSVSGHKIHAPKGVGILYVGEKVKIHPIIHGGGHQKNLRSGTENVPGSAGIALAAQMVYENLDCDVEKLYTMKKYFVDNILKIEGVQVNGLVPTQCGYDVYQTAPHVVSASIAGVRSEVLLHALEERGIYISAGSACASNKPQTSATMKAIGLQKEYWDSTIRFSFSAFTTIEELDYALRTLYDLISQLRRYTRR